MLRALAILAAAAVMVALAAPAAAPARVRDCHAAADFNIIITSARNMTCGAAKFDMRRNKHSISKHFTSPKGFSCNRISGGRLGGTWRCTKGSKAYRFDFGD